MEYELTILVVDDGDMNRRLLAKFIDHLGHKMAMATNGAEAVEYCRHHIPDVILMDVMMPVMDGFEATIAIRELLGDRWIPIIFLTAMTEHDSLLQGLRVGGDDYLTKPIDLSMLSAKIKVMLRISEMQRRIAEDTARLNSYYQDNEQEQEFAKHVLDRFNAQAGPTPANISQWLQPALNFSGDVICAARTPTGVDHVLLADSTGHGLAAAISCMPAVDTFLVMTQRGFGIGTIAQSINSKLNGVLPTGRFVAAALIEIDYKERVIAVWNGGIPCVFFLNQNGRVEKQFISNNPPLGTMPDEYFDAGLDLHRWEFEGQLVACSDGVTEARSPDNGDFGEDGVVESAKKAIGQNIADAIAADVATHLAGLDGHDDISLVVVDCKESYGGKGEPSDASLRLSHTGLSDWEVKVTFTAAQLSEKDCFPILVGWLNQLGLDQNQFGDILLVLTELYNNALDHGILKLSSQLKSAEDGFIQFMTERLIRLSDLKEGSVTVGMARMHSDRDPVLKIWIIDSGNGFDYEKLDLANISDDGAQTHGRGLAMVARICRSISFKGNGNEVVAEYLL